MHFRSNKITLFIVAHALIAGNFIYNFFNISDIYSYSVIGLAVFVRNYNKNIYQKSNKIHN